MVCVIWHVCKFNLKSLSQSHLGALAPLFLLRNRECVWICIMLQKWKLRRFLLALPLDKRRDMPLGKCKHQGLNASCEVALTLITKGLLHFICTLLERYMGLLISIRCLLFQECYLVNKWTITWARKIIQKFIPSMSW